MTDEPEPPATHTASVQPAHSTQPAIQPAGSAEATEFSAPTRAEEPTESMGVREARRLLNTPWRTDSRAVLEGARRLIAQGQEYGEEAATALALTFGTNHRVGSATRIEAARIRADLGGDHLLGAAVALRGVITEYRGYVEEWDNIDGAHALALLAPEYFAEGSWELREIIRSHHADDSDRAYAIRHLAGLRGPGLMPEPPAELQDFPAYGLSAGTARTDGVDGVDGVDPSGSMDGTTGFIDHWTDISGTVRGRPDQPLWFVSHGHRLPGAATVVVSTWRGPDSGSWGRPAHGPAEALAHAQVDSLAGALHLAFPPEPNTAGSPTGSSNARQELEDFAKPLVSPRRHRPTVDIAVDGSLVPFDVLQVADAWSAVATLGPLVIGAYGRGTALADHHLVTRSGSAASSTASPSTA